MNKGPYTVDEHNADGEIVASWLCEKFADELYCESPLAEGHYLGERHYLPPDSLDVE